MMATDAVSAKGDPLSKIPPMAAKEQFVEDEISHVEAGIRLIEGILGFNEETAAAIADQEAGMTVTEAFARHDSAAWSRRISTLLEAYEESRREVRRSAVIALKEEGRTANEVAEAFGTTRQWVSQLFRKNKGGVATG